VSGSLSVEAVVKSSASIKRVDFLLDGNAIDTESIAPYWLGGDSGGNPLGIDTRDWSDGAHQLKAVAVDSADQRGSTTVNFTVRNAEPKSDRPDLRVTGITQGATVSGRIDVEAIASSPAGIREVRFVLDGRRIDTEYIAPYWLGGDSGGNPTGFDTRKWSNGKHTFRVRAVDRNGVFRTEDFEITVRN
jgi:hypothetical protein